MKYKINNIIIDACSPIDAIKKIKDNEYAIYTLQSDADKNLYFYIGKTKAVKNGAWTTNWYKISDLHKNSPEELKADLLKNGWHEVANTPLMVDSYVKDETYRLANYNGNWYYEIIQNDGFKKLVGPYNSKEEAISFFKKHRPNETLIIDSDEEDLSYLSEEEKGAIEDYKKAISNTSNPKLLELYKHILEEEIEHLKELQNSK